MEHRRRVLRVWLLENFPYWLHGETNQLLDNTKLIRDDWIPGNYTYRQSEYQELGSTRTQKIKFLVRVFGYDIG